MGLTALEAGSAIAHIASCIKTGSVSERVFERLTHLLPDMTDVLSPRHRSILLSLAKLGNDVPTVIALYSLRSIAHVHPDSCCDAP